MKGYPFSYVNVPRSCESLPYQRENEKMRNITDKSVKLNRQLDKLLVEAMKKDLLVKIGWGREQDEKPREGEIGAITHLPKKSKVLLLGNLGECAGAMNRGGVFTLQGSATSMLGAFQNSGKIIVERDVGAKAGYGMKGGSIIIQGSVGNEAGASMRDGTIVVRGHAGDRLGANMKGGIGIILGSTGSEPGVGMTGGKLIIAGSCPPPGQGVMMRSIRQKEIEYCEEYLSPLGLSVNEDALVLETSEKIESHDLAGNPVMTFPYDVGDIDINRFGDLHSFSVNWDDFDQIDENSCHYLLIDDGDASATDLGYCGIQTFEA
jgi:glutamate synthase domain-containing protein 3